MNAYDFYLSIDPGIGEGTGIVVWQNGQVIDSKTIWMTKRRYAKKSMHERLLLLQDEITAKILLNYISLDNPEVPIKEAVVERPYIQTPKEKLDSIYTLCYGTAAIIILLVSAGIPVVEITKTKGDCKIGGKHVGAIKAAEFHAARFGIKGSNHVRSAVHLGVIRGYDLPDDAMKRNQKLQGRRAK